MHEQELDRLAERHRPNGWQVRAPGVAGQDAEAGSDGDGGDAGDRGERQRVVRRLGARAGRPTEHRDAGERRAGKRRAGGEQGAP